MHVHNGVRSPTPNTYNDVKSAKYHPCRCYLSPINRALTNPAAFPLGERSLTPNLIRHSGREIRAIFDSLMFSDPTPLVLEAL